MLTGIITGQRRPSLLGPGCDDGGRIELPRAIEGGVVVGPRAGCIQYAGAAMGHGHLRRWFALAAEFLPGRMDHEERYLERRSVPIVSTLGAIHEQSDLLRLGGKDLGLDADDPADEQQDVDYRRYNQRGHAVY